MLVKNLERFSRDNSVNPGWIIVFDKATNLFTPETLDMGTPDLDTNHYIVLNYIFSCLKELSI